MGLPGGPVVKIPCFQSKGNGFNLGGGTKIPHACMLWQKKQNKTSYELDSLEGTTGLCAEGVPELLA